MPIKIPAHVRERQINELPNTSFVRWDGEYRNNTSRAICRCAIDGYEWPVRAKDLLSPMIKHKTGCPQCAKQRVWSAEERAEQINSLPNISFVRWVDEYKSSKSKAVCRCSVDGHEWQSNVCNLINHHRGCPQCSGMRRWTAKEREDQINDLLNIRFIRWESGYKGSDSKAVCRCEIDGCEWAASSYHLVNRKSGCPKCAKTGYDPSKQGTLYILRSACGSMAKIGISNRYKARFIELKYATPFDWSCIELIHSDDGAFIAKIEKELHQLTEQAQFSESFGGYTEWRKWDDRIPMWIEEYRARA